MTYNPTPPEGNPGQQWDPGPRTVIDQIMAEPMLPDQAQAVLDSRRYLSETERREVQYQIDTARHNLEVFAQNAIDRDTDYVREQTQRISDAYEALESRATALNQAAYLSELGPDEARKQLDELMRERERLGRLEDSLNSAGQRVARIREDRAGYAARVHAKFGLPLPKFVIPR